MDNLKDIYKRVLKCSRCGVKYGSDLKKDNGLCHLCSEAKKARLAKKVKKRPKKVKKVKKINKKTKRSVKK